MKQPRTSDFDPSARTREPQRDLKSPMADFPAIERPASSPAATSAEQVQEEVLVLPVRDVREMPTSMSAPPTPTIITGRRKIKSRHPFDIYEDQLEELKHLSVEDRMRGGLGSMSAMVRQAIDDYIVRVRAR